MRKIFKKKTTIIISTAIALLFAGSFLIYRNAKAVQPLPTVSQWIDVFQGWLRVAPTSKRVMLESFCKTASLYQNGFSDTSIYYTPQYSVFLWILCKPLKVELFFDDEYLMEWFDDNWNKLPGIPTACNPQWETKDLRWCDLSILLKAIFSTAMNDHATLAMWWWAMSEQEVETVIENFSHAYFGKDICSSNTPYISNVSSAWGEFCSHKDTYNYLKRTIEQFRKQLKNLKLINPQKIQDITSDAGECKIDPETGFSNVFLCSYSSNSPQDQVALQTNIVYNELMYYNLLSNWIILKYKSDNQGLWEVSFLDAQKHTTADIQELYWEEIYALQRELKVSQEAVNMTQKIIANYWSTYPLHIWLLAYYEDIVAIRKALVKVYTPIHQLYYTLRNVQTNE